ncbi:MAG: hypothetical protein KF799_15460 [Bdellovibrionales bacterium]|nr:hypothetical protein [Bdellovibrionales bacterium]
MMRTQIYFLLVILSATTSGCASHLYLKSEPAGARVELISAQNQAVTPLGETPLTMTKTQITQKQVRGPYLIRISKDGLLPKEILIASLTGIDVDVNVQLQASASTARLNDLVNELFDAQNMAQKGDGPSALEKLNQLQKKHPDIAAVYEMRGSIYMVRGDYASAARDFGVAVNIDPQNRELRVLLESAQRKAGLKR